jgi:N-acetylglucosaminyldiphosphoundecaprenol N-acetyl-beta-D-mannosaminyltransferase
MSVPLNASESTLQNRLTASVASKPHRASIRMQTPLCHSAIDRVGVGHALIDNCSLREACHAIVSHAKSGGRPAYVTTANAQHIVLLDRDPRLRQIYESADLVVADGFSLLLAARIHRRFLQERIAGVDMFQTLCDLAAENSLHVFLLGGLPRSADLAASVVKRRSSSLRISTYCPPFGFEKTTVGLEKTARAVRAAKPDLLFVGLGAPKQEYWIYDHGLRLSIPVLIGVGGSFEMVAGVVPRAPMWIQSLGCEWLYRLAREPRRLWRRYLFGNLEFAGIILRQSIRRAFLTQFFSLLDKDRFGAEVFEHDVQSKGELLANLLKVRSRHIESNAWVEPCEREV